MRKMILLAAAALACAGCVPLLEAAGSAAGAGASATADGVVVHASQALVLAHNAYQGAAATAQARVEAGGLSDAQLGRIKMLSDRAVELLEQGDRGLSVAQRAAEVFDIVAELDLFGGRQ